MFSAEVRGPSIVNVPSTEMADLLPIYPYIG